VVLSHLVPTVETGRLGAARSPLPGAPNFGAPGARASNEGIPVPVVSALVSRAFRPFLSIRRMSVCFRMPRWQRFSPYPLEVVGHV
jgi:hypothetical protein